VALEDELRGDRLEHTLEKFVNPVQWQREELLVQAPGYLCTQTKQQGKESVLRRFLPGGGAGPYSPVDPKGRVRQSKLHSFERVKRSEAFC